MDGKASETSFVTSEDLKRGFERLRGAAIDPREGLFGPRSMVWEVNKHSLVYFLGAVQSVLMQLGHPWVATAVFEHSKILKDPRARARLTYTFLWSLLYGDLETVLRMSQALFQVHGRVKGSLPEGAGAHPMGSTYGANERNALLYVHVTAFACRAKLYDAIVRPLETSEKDRLVDEMKRYALCFGIPEAMHPRTWDEVERYLLRMESSPVLGRTEPGVVIARFLRSQLPRPVRGPLFVFLCSPLSERQRRLLDLPANDAANRRTTARLTRLFRLLERVLPARLATVPAYQEAMERLAGRREPSAWVAAMNRALLGRPRLVL